MTSSRPARAGWIALGLGPVIAAALVLVASSLSAVDPDERARQLGDRFARVLEDAADVARATLAESPHDAMDAAPRYVRDRLEGVARLDAGRHFIDWSGRMPEPPADLTDPSTSSWRLVPQGARTRLLARAGPGPDGTWGIASMIVESRPGDFDAMGLFGPALLRDVDLTVELREVSDVDDDDAVLVPLAAPDGAILATAVVRPVPAEFRGARIRARALAWAVTVAILLAAVVLPWRRLVATWGGFAAAVGAVAAARWLLLVTRVPATLLPRDLGGAGLYGSSAGRGLLASPADLILTATAACLVAWAIAAVVRRTRESRPGLAAAIALVWSIPATAGVVALTYSLARNSSIALDQAPGFWRLGGASLLTLGLAGVMLAAAVGWGAAFCIVRRRSATSERVAIAVAYLLLSMVAADRLVERGQALAIERLGVEIVPQIVDQSSRRALALASTLRHIRQRFAEGETVDEFAALPEAYLAYRVWIESELFHGGYASSLDFYHPSGALLSHFAFDLPALDEEIEPGGDDVREWTEEFSPRAALAQVLLHGQVPVRRGDVLLGTVVGHVLDEPDNLSFLPRSQPYLAALGPGTTPGGEFDDGPQYVRYDAHGTVLVSTIERPPSSAAALRGLTGRGDDRLVRVSAGAEDWIGLALREPDGLHLVLLRRRGVSATLALAVRLGLIGPLIVLALATLGVVVRGGGPAAIVAAVRGSFYRKLLAALLVASVVPLVGMGLVLRGYIERRADTAFADRAIELAGIAQQHIEDFVSGPLGLDGTPPQLNDDFLYWLRTVVGQEVHVYESGRLLASSKPELFDSGLIPGQIPGEAYRAIAREGLPHLVRPARLGPAEFPVAYAPIRTRQPSGELVVAVPLVLEQRELRRAIDRVLEVILLVIVLLVGLLGIAAASVARTVARPVRELVAATGRIAAGDYDTRLEPRTHDEIAELVRGFNGMAASLGGQRADLERQRDYVETLLAHATTGVLSTDPDGVIVTSNPAARELLREPGARLVPGRPLVEALAEAPALAPLAAALDRPPSAGVPEEIDFERDGRARRFRLVRVPLPDPGGDTVGTLVLIDDVTDLMRSNQLAAWAEMARAIAHEIKNPLTPIQLSTEHLRRLLTDRGVLPAVELDACLDTVIKQVRTLYDIAGEFSAYAKLPQLDLADADPVAFMRECIGPYRTAPPPGIAIVERLVPAGTVAIDRRVLGRAIVNLIENALQAMPDGGELIVGVAPGAQNESVLSVADTGVGLDDEARRRLFEPYFSTKSSGTGLGLAIVQRAVDAHRGHVEVTSERGRGTTFRIGLPRADEAARGH